MSFGYAYNVLFDSDVLATQLNLEVPKYEFDEVDGKLIVG